MELPITAVGGQGERDRLRQVLENLGWSFHRVWSTDWFHNSARERQKLADAISLAIARCAPSVREPLQNVPPPFPQREVRQ